MVINHPAAALCIHPPMFETTVAVHTTVKAACLNGRSVDVSRLRAALLRSFASSAGSEYVSPPYGVQRGSADDPNRPVPERFPGSNQFD